MSFRKLVPAAAIAVILGVTAVTTSSAAPCYAPPQLCALFDANDPAPAPPAEAKAEVKAEVKAKTPLKLESYVRTPAAASAPRAVKAPRALKKREARASHDKAKHHSKRQLAKVRSKPAVVRNDATEAYALDTAALVRVVGSDEFNEIDSTAAPGSETPLADPTDPAREPLQVSALEQRDAMLAISLEKLARQLAAMPRPEVQVQSQPGPQPEPETWLQWALSRLTRVYASASAAVRTLLG